MKRKGNEEEETTKKARRWKEIKKERRVKSN
jgi:hypothetical protein